MRDLSCSSHRAPIDVADDRGMRTWVKAAVVLLVTLPMMAYVAGRLAAVPADLGPRAPVILHSPVVPERSAVPTPNPRDDEEDLRDGGVRVVNPHPTRVVGEDDVTADESDDDGTDDD